MSAAHASPRPRWHGLLGWLAKLAVAALLLAVLARQLPLGAALSALGAVPAWLWLAGLLLNALVIAVDAWRWHLTALRTIPLKTCFAYSWIGHFYATVLPGAVIGDAAKTAALASSEAAHRTLVLPVSIALARLLALISLVLVLALALVALAWERHSLHPALAVGIAVLAAGGCVLAPLLMRRLLAFVQHLRILPERILSVLARTSTIIEQAGGRWFLLLALSFLVHVLAGALFALAARELGVAAEFWRLCVYYVATSLVIMLPVTIAGLGAREQISLWILGGSSAVTVLPVTLAWYLLLASAAHALGGGLLQLVVWGRAARPAARDCTP